MFIMEVTLLQKPGQQLHKHNSKCFDNMDTHFREHWTYTCHFWAWIGYFHIYCPIGTSSDLKEGATNGPYSQLCIHVINE